MILHLKRQKLEFTAMGRAIILFLLECIYFSIYSKNDCTIRKKKKRQDTISLTVVSTSHCSAYAAVSQARRKHYFGTQEQRVFIKNLMV